MLATLELSRAGTGVTKARSMIGWKARHDIDESRRLILFLFGKKMDLVLCSLSSLLLCYTLRAWQVNLGISRHISLHL